MIKSQLETQQKESSKDSDSAKVNQPFFVKQTIGNACGTIALLHSICNNVEKVGGVKEGSFLETFMTVTDPYMRAQCLMEDEKFEATHQHMAVAGDTSAEEHKDT